MARVKSPQPGNSYKVVCADNQIPCKEVEFKFVNVTRDGGYEIEVAGQRRIVGHFCELCHPFACEVRSV